VKYGISILIIVAALLLFRSYLIAGDDCSLGQKLKLHRDNVKAGAVYQEADCGVEELQFEF
jgi:hypothetical protein